MFVFVIILCFYKLVIVAFPLMRKRKIVEDLITRSLKEISKRALTLNRKDKIAISQEFKEWIHGVSKEEDIWVINHPIK